MSQHDVSELAVTDMDDIWEYIAQDNRAAASRQLLKFEEHFKLLAVTPGMGRMRNELASGLRSFPVGSYIIYYREVEVGVRILRVLYGARQVENLFAQESELEISPDTSHDDN